LPKLLLTRDHDVETSGRASANTTKLGPVLTGPPTFVVGFPYTPSMTSIFRWSKGFRKEKRKMKLLCAPQISVCVTSAARLSLNSSKVGLAWLSLRRQLYVLRLI
jgi:hypothetical protein